MAGLQVAMISERSAKTYLIVLEEETSVIFIRNVVLEESLVTVQVGELDIKHNGIVGKHLGAGIGRKPQVSVLRNKDGSVGLGRTSSFGGFKPGYFQILPFLRAFACVECSFQHGSAFPMQQVRPVIEGPDTQRLGNVFAQEDLGNLNILAFQTVALYGNGAFAASAGIH